MRLRLLLFFLSLGALLVLGALSMGFLPGLTQTTYNSVSVIAAVSTSSLPATSAPVYATHIAAPAAVHGIYMTSWVAGIPRLRNPLIALSSTTPINAVVIDVKDYTGHLAFIPKDPGLKALGAYQNRISDIDSFIAELHERGIYVIGRVVTFQDPIMADKHPDWAVQNGAVTKTKEGKRVENSSAIVGTVWKDNAGLEWVDPGASGNWEYLREIAEEAYSRGFDEINFDYVRFPSDGDVVDALFPASATTSPPVVLTSFFQYVNANIRGYTQSPEQIGLKVSADLFGMTTTAEDDMGIGQVVDDALPYFDYIDPMVYPSHYSHNWGGFAVPDSHPYEVVKESMASAVARAQALAAGTIATTTTSGLSRRASIVSSIEAIPLADRVQVTPGELRPWLQDFQLHGIPYTPAMISSEIQATTDVGLSSWLLWDPNNKYTASTAALAGK